jgi:predicted N-acetyltransferase YhbS
MLSFDIRTMTAADIDAVLQLLCNVAGSIPVLLNTKERRDVMLSRLRACYLGGFSLVAADQQGAIAGFQLAERRQMFSEPEAIWLDYSGVSEKARNKGIYRELIKQQQRRGLRLRVEVLLENTSGLGAILTRYGFHRMGKTVYVWQPDIKTTQRKAAPDRRR